MFYDVSTLLPKVEWFHGDVDQSIASIIGAVGVVRVDIDPTDAEAVASYFTHSDRPLTLRRAANAQLKNFKKLQLRYIHADENDEIVFRIAPPRSKWLPGCCIYLEIPFEVHPIAMSAVTNDTNALIDFALNRSLKEAQAYECISKTVRKQIQKTYRGPIRARCRIYLG